MPTPEQRQSIMRALLARGAKLEDMQKAVASLKTEEEQNSFWSSAGEKVGIAYRAFESDKMSAKFEPDVQGKVGVPGERVFIPDAPPYAAGASQAETNVTPGYKAYRGLVSGISKASMGLAPIVASEVTGESPEEFKKFVNEALEEAPLEGAVGEMAGLGPQGQGRVVGSAISVGLRGGQKVLSKLGNAFSNLANRLSASSFDLPASVLDDLSVDELSKLGQMMRDRGVTNTPRTMVKVREMVERIHKSAERRLVGVFNKMTQKLPKEVYSSADDISEMMKANHVELRASRGLEPVDEAINMIDEEISPYLQKELKGAAGNPNKLWAIAKDLENKGRAFVGSAVKSEASKGKIYRDAAASIRNHLEDLASRDVFLGTDMSKVLQGLNARWRLSNEALDAATSQVKGGFKPGVGTGVRLGKGGKISMQLPGQPTRGLVTAAAEKAQELSNWGAELLSYGQELGPYYPMLLKALKRNGLEGVAKAHAYKMQDDKKYRDLVEQITSGKGGILSVERAEVQE